MVHVSALQWGRKEGTIHEIVSGVGCIVVTSPGCVCVYTCIYIHEKLSWSAEKELFIFLLV